MDSKNYAITTFGSYVRITPQKLRQNYVKKLRQINLRKLHNKIMQMESKNYEAFSFGSYIRIQLQKPRQNYFMKLPQSYVRKVRKKAMQMEEKIHDHYVIACVIITALQRNVASWVFAQVLSDEHLIYFFFYLNQLLLVYKKSYKHPVVQSSPCLVITFLTLSYGFISESIGWSEKLFPLIMIL